MRRDFFQQFVGVGLGIVLLAAALYCADVFYFAPHRIPPCVPAKIPAGHICPQDLLSKWQDKEHPGHYRVVWIDARSESDYELNHLVFDEERTFPIRPGANMQQLRDAAIERLCEAADRRECIVVFCTAACTSSDEVAAYLREVQLIDAPIYVLEGGWPAVQKMQLIRE